MRSIMLCLTCLSIWSSGCACCGKGNPDTCATGRCECKFCRANRATVGPFGQCGMDVGLTGDCPCCRERAYTTGVDRASVRESARTRARDTLRTIVENDSRPLTCHFRGGFEQAYIDIAEGVPNRMPDDPTENGWNAAGLWLTNDYYSAIDWYDGYTMGASMVGDGGTEPPSLMPLSRRPKSPTVSQAARQAMIASAADE